MHLFIDTNIYLSFYHYTGDDLEELKKLVVLIQKKKLSLYLPQQVVQEFARNREAKIADALKNLKEQKLNLQFPQMCKDFDEYSKLRTLQQEYEKHHAVLQNKLREAVADRSLKADEITSQLFKLAQTIPCPTELLQKARTRVVLGNPPGKNESLGDAVNWEALLAAVPNGTNLDFITDDRDYSSPLAEDQFNGYLLEEWSKAKKSSLTFHRRLSGFFGANFPDIKLATELEKELVINDLSNSESFSQTHLAIAKLSHLTDFTKSQVNAILSAALSNSQVFMITDDEDVQTFYAGLITKYSKIADPDLLAQAQQHVLSKNEPPTFDDDDIPF